MPQIHQVHGFHGGIQAQQIAVNFETGAPTLLTWWQAKSLVQPVGAYALFKGDFKYLMGYDYVALLWVLADCLAAQHSLDPPSAKFARMLRDDDRAGIEAWMQGEGSRCSGWKLLDSALFCLASEDSKGR